jgi:hypothetical protein
MNRTLIGFVHCIVAFFWIAVVSTGVLNLPAFVLWLVLCAAADQAVVWPLWLAGGRKGRTPNRSWF